MKLSEFIAYLYTLPKETEIMVLREHDVGYHGYSARFEPLDLDEGVGNVEFIDMRNNPLAKGEPYERSITLYLGEK